MSVIRRFFSALFWGCAALVVLFEEWMWEPLRRVMLRFGQLPVVRWLSAGIARLPARWAAVVFLLPVVALLPFKLGGVWLIAHGHVGFGLLVFLGAKIAGTALFAWLLALTKPTLLTLPWFARLYANIVTIRDTVHRYIRRQRAYRLARIQLRRLRRLFAFA